MSVSFLGDFLGIPPSTCTTLENNYFLRGWGDFFGNISFLPLLNILGDGSLRDQGGLYRRKYLVVWWWISTLHSPDPFLLLFLIKITFL